MCMLRSDLTDHGDFQIRITRVIHSVSGKLGKIEFYQLFLTPRVETRKFNLEFKL